MSDSRRDEEALEEASREAARALWQTVLLGRERRGTVGTATRKKLVERVLDLMRGVRGR